MVVPAGCWQAARPLGDYALAGCAVAPGFELGRFVLMADVAEEAAHLRSEGASRSSQLNEELKARKLEQIPFEGGTAAAEQEAREALEAMDCWRKGGNCETPAELPTERD